jgi:hypothetical protein
VENIEKVVAVVVNEMAGYEERRKRNDWYDKECQVKTKEINKARIKMPDRRTRMNTENYKNERREAKKMCRAKNGARDLAGRYGGSK